MRYVQTSVTEQLNMIQRGDRRPVMAFRDVSQTVRGLKIAGRPEHGPRWVRLMRSGIVPFAMRICGPAAQLRGMVVKSLLAVSAVLVFILSPGLVSGQSPLSSLGLSNWNATANAKVGYQHLTLNVSVPTAVPAFGVSIPQPIDLQVKRAGQVVGSVGLEVEPTQWCRLFVNFEGVIPRNVTATSSVDPVFSTIGLFGAVNVPVDWRGTHLELWNVDVGGSVDTRFGVAAVGGFRFEHLSLALRDPVDPFGISAFAVGSLNAVNYDADVQAKVWIPYFGVQWNQPQFRASLLYSPCAWSQVRVPLSLYAAVGFPIGPATLNADLAVSWRYRVYDPGAFVEGNLEYETDVRGFKLLAWCKASYLKIRGEGDLDLGTDFNLQIPPVVNVQVSAAASGNANSAYSRRLLAGGLSLGREF
jgi:hypothetical protein